VSPVIAIPRAREIILTAADSGYAPDTYDEDELFSALSLIARVEMGDDSPFITWSDCSRIAIHVRESRSTERAKVEQVDQWESFLASLYADTDDDSEEDLTGTEPCSATRHTWTCSARCTRLHRGAGLPAARDALYVPEAWVRAYGTPTTGQAFRRKATQARASTRRTSRRVKVLT
jgi:hypothetical protein